MTYDAVGLLFLSIRFFTVDCSLSHGEYCSRAILEDCQEFGSLFIIGQYEVGVENRHVLCSMVVV